MTKSAANNFDALRLVAAVLVVLGHSFVLTGYAPYGLLGHAVSTLAVLIFFSISGYLITRSWMNDPHPGRFALRRARRIVPALATVVIICAYVVGPFLSPLPAGQYLTHAQTFRYLGNIVFHVAYNLPLVFAGNIYPNAVNGSLWTLPVEVAMYALAPFLVMAERFRLGAACAFVLFVALGLYNMVVHPAEFVIAGTGFWSATLVAPYFVGGSIIAALSLERLLSPAATLAALCVVQFVPVSPEVREALLCLVLPCAVLAVGLRSWPGLRSVGRVGDASYGIYLWAFPVQQLIVHLMGAAGGGWGNFLVALPASAALGFLSWHLIEKRALRWRRGPRAAGAGPSPAAAR